MVEEELLDNLEEEVENYVILHEVKGIPQLHGCFFRNTGQAGKFEYFLL